MEEILSFKNVCANFGDVPVVRGVSFALARSEILCVIGESGSGKTTLLRAAMGLLPKGVASGEIIFRGQNLLDLPERELRKIRGAKIGIVFQDSGAFFCPVRRVDEQIFESLAAHGQISREAARERTLETFEKLNFDEGSRVLDCYPFELSGGMAQRVGIAAALMPKPEILLADEPTSALDPVAGKKVLREILASRDMLGTSVVLVTHDIAVARTVADRILVLNRGQVAECAPASEILRAPRSAAAKKLLAAEPYLRRP